MNFFEAFSGRWRHHGWFWDSGFKNKHFTSNFHLLLSFIFLSLSIHEIQVWVNDVTMGVKNAIFWKSDLRNKLLTSKFYQVLNSIVLSPLIHDIQLWPLFIQFGANDITKEINTLKFWNINYIIGFDFLKMTGIVEVSIVTWLQYIIMKPFSRALENDIIKGPLFNTFDQAFYNYKSFVISVFWNKYSSFVPIFIMIDWKLVPIQGTLYFHLTRNYTGNLLQSWKFDKDDVHNFGAWFDVDLQLLLNSYFWQVFHLTNKV